MTRRCALGLLLLLLAVATAPVGAAAFDAEQEFAQGTKAIGLSFGGGAQNNVENHGRLSGISFVNFNPRLSYFFFEPFGPSILHGAFETGLEGWFQYYLGPKEATAEGLKLAFRYHLLGLSVGRFVPYLEGTAGAAGTDLKGLARQVCPRPVYVRREIVHKRHVVEALRAKGAHFVDELDEVPDDATVIFSAHGVSPAVRQEARRRGLRVIDATCPLVTKVHLEAIRYAREGYSIVLVGHADHDEVVGTMGEAPERMFLIAHPEEVDRLQIPDPDKVAYLTQTTLSVDDTRDCIEALRRRFPKIAGPAKDDICYATQNRQASAKTVAGEVDVLLVIGAANSSNANRLVEVSTVMGTPSYLINDKNDIKTEWLAGSQRVGVTAGASTPEFLVTEVVQALQQAGRVAVREVHVVE